MTTQQAKALYAERRNFYEVYPEKKQAAYEYAKGYREFIDSAKTEREAVDYAVDYAKARGFSEFDPDKHYSAGDRVYYVNRKKAIYLAVIGKKPMNEGCRIIVAHTDSPRLDLKQHPLFESDSMAYFKTHYYGGIKKYQWLTLPLSLHGVIYRKDGSAVKISIGEDESEPVFYISDLMPHIGKDQMSKTMSEAIPGESLNLICGSIPFGDGEGTKTAILALLNEKYGINEGDLINAELTAAPALKSRDCGLDGSMIIAYGHDDRVCAYPALTALCELETPEHTAIAMFTDKEEIGSQGVTGLMSDCFSHFLQDLCEMQNTNYRRMCENSICFSADVGGAYDSSFAAAYEPTNSAYLNCGVVVTKYTGARGKSGCSDASAEVFSRVTRLLDAHNVLWQTGEYGKVDQGGAGTVAAEIAMLNIDVIDVGVPLLSMHAVQELCCKSDLYEMYEACKALYE